MLGSDGGIAEGLARVLLWALAGVAVAIVALLLVSTVVGFALTGLVHAVRRWFGWSEDEFYDDEFEEYARYEADDDEGDAGESRG